ncbi:MAG: hypothetical protein AAGG80_07320 [Pseudomonadota bacterium]
MLATYVTFFCGEHALTDMKQCFADLFLLKFTKPILISFAIIISELFNNYALMPALNWLLTIYDGFFGCKETKEKHRQEKILANIAHWINNCNLSAYINIEKALDLDVSNIDFEAIPLGHLIILIASAGDLPNAMSDAIKASINTKISQFASENTTTEIQIPASKFIELLSARAVLVKHNSESEKTSNVKSNEFFKHIEKLINLFDTELVKTFSIKDLVKIKELLLQIQKYEAKDSDMLKLVQNEINAKPMSLTKGLDVISDNWKKLPSLSNLSCILFSRSETPAEEQPLLGSPKNVCCC